MIDIIISSIIIIFIMLAFVLIIFKNIVRRINQNSKQYFVNKLYDYNDIVEEKEKQIDTLTEEIKVLQKNKNELEEYKKLNTSKKKKSENFKITSNIKVPKYREENFFYNYKELKQKFDFDKEELIKNFIEENKDKNHERDYKTLLNLKNKFNKEATYQLMTLPGSTQLEIIETLLTDREKKLVNIDDLNKNKEKFNIIELFKIIDEKILEIDPTINVYVSKYDKNYDYIDPYVKTKNFSNMSEGIIIQYKGKKYDYSI